MLMSVDPSTLDDTEFVLYLLRQGPHCTNEILRESFRLRGVGLTVHSRVANAREKLPKHERITCERKGAYGNGRPRYEYRIVPAEVPVTVEASGQAALVLA
jgi:hypothetical protein